MSQFQIIIFSLILVLLICLAAFFSFAETGLMAVNRYRLRHKARLKKRYAVLLLRLLKRPDRVLSTILIGNTFANMLASSLATLLAYHFWGEKGALLVAFLLTFTVLIFAEIAPKTLAAIFPDRTARMVAFPIYFIMQLIYPAVWIANAITNSLLRLLRVRVTSLTVEPLSRDELRSIVHDTTGKISRQYQNMLLSILDLNKLTVGDVMIPRHEITGIDIEESWEKIVDRISQLHQNWVPFYRHDINEIIGVLYTHDVLRMLINKPTLNKEVLKQFLQEPYFVPEGTSLHHQLSHFQRSHDKVAFVVDEYGEIQGLITLNDILEEIVGDFTSTMSGVKRIKPQEDGSFIVEGATSIREFNKETGYELPVSGPRTVNGLITEYLQMMPHSGIAILIANYPIEIMQVKDNRVRQAKIFPRLKENF